MLVDRMDPKNINAAPMVNLSNPLRRDTFHIPAEGSVTLRIVADNPGVWFLHCTSRLLVRKTLLTQHLLSGHMEWHLEAGLAIQVVEAPLQVQSLSRSIPSKMLSNCKELKIPHSGNAAGRPSVDDLRGLPLGPFPRKQELGHWTVFRYLELQSVKSIAG